MALLCSSRGPKFNFKQPHGGLWPFIVDLMPSSGVQAFIQTEHRYLKKQTKPTRQKNLKKKKKHSMDLGGSFSLSPL